MSAVETFIPTEQHGWLVSRDEESKFRVRVARDAQAQWMRVPIAERCRRVAKAADELLARMEEVADLICAENGKQRVEAIAHDIAGSLDAIRFACGAAPDVLAEKSVAVTFAPHRAASIVRRPFGVVLVISPWNFPLSIPLGQVAAALVAGNAVILKPSEYTPKVGALIESLLRRSELPPSLFQVVTGDGKAGAELIAAGPDKVCFTGSVSTGRKVMAACAEGPGAPIPCSLELGGIDALIVCEDADLELATSAALWGAFMNTGQVCASVERILVHESVRTQFIGRLIQKMERIDPNRDLGRVTMPRQGQVYEKHVADSQKRGLEVLAGGKWLSDGKYAPTLVSGPGVEASDVYRDETFGPIAAIGSFRDEAELIRKHDDTPFGLTASVFTGDLARGERIARALHCGLVSVNDVAATLHAFAALPWGGRGASGFGRSHGEEGLLEMTWPKVLDLPRTVGGSALLGGMKRPWWFPYDGDQLQMMREFTRLIGDDSLSRRVGAALRMPKSLLASFKKHPRI